MLLHLHAFSTCILFFDCSGTVHHDCEVSCLFSAGHLHRIQEKVAFADCIPAQIARYFMSAPIKKVFSNLCPSIVIDFMDFVSSEISFTDTDKFSYFSCAFSIASHR